MTIETKRRLVALIASGKNTRAEVLAALPDVDEDDLNYALRSPDDAERLIIERDGVLSLTDAGKDILFLMKEEQKQQFYIVLGVIASFIAAICGLVELLRN